MALNNGKIFLMSKVVLKNHRRKKNQLQLVHEDKICFQGKLFRYEILGRLSIDLTDLTVMLVVSFEAALKRIRRKIDLYDHLSVNEFSSYLMNETGIDQEDIFDELSLLTDLLETYREQNRFQELPEEKIRKNTRAGREAAELLNAKNLVELLDEMLETAGVQAGRKERIGLFMTMCSYKSKIPLHVMLLGGESNSKSHLLNSFEKCFPKNDVLNLTRVTDKSIYYLSSEMLQSKLVLFHNYENFSENGITALNHLQTNHELTMSATKRDRFGNLVSSIKKTEARFASILSAEKSRGTKVDLPFLICLSFENSKEQSLKMMEYETKKLAGKIDETIQDRSRIIVRSLVQLLQTKPVIIPFADKIILTENTLKNSRMFAQILRLVSQVAFVHQFQRNIDDQGRILAEPIDLKIALDLFGDSIFKSSVEFSESVQHFYHRLENFIANRIDKEKNYFTSTELRNELGYNRIFVFRALDHLLRAGLVIISGGTANRGYHYSLTEKNMHADSNVFLKDELNSWLNKNL